MRDTKEVKKNIYDDPDFCGFAGCSLHPGGLGLTIISMQFAKLPKGAKILDIGCGFGETMAFLEAKQGFEVWGLEKSQVMIDKAFSKHPQLKIVKGDGKNLPFDNQSFDCVLAECVFSLIEDKTKALQEINRVLKPKGKLILSDLYYRKAPVSDLYCKAGIQRLLSVLCFESMVWQDFKTLYKTFVAQSIMACDGRSDYKRRFAGISMAELKAGDISYYSAIWQKAN